MEPNVEPHLVFSTRGAEEWDRLNDFQRLMARLDALLTNKTVDKVLLQGTARNQARDGNIVEWIISNHIWYLSDGGYSRIYCDDEGTLALGSESRPQVKARWNDAAVVAARTKVSEAIKAAIEGATS